MTDSVDAHRLINQVIETLTNQTLTLSQYDVSNLMHDDHSYQLHPPTIPRQVHDLPHITHVQSMKIDQQLAIELKGPGLAIVIIMNQDQSTSVLATYTHDDQEDVFIFNDVQVGLRAHSASLYIIDPVDELLLLTTDYYDACATFHAHRPLLLQVVQQELRLIQQKLALQVVSLDDVSTPTSQTNSCPTCLEERPQHMQMLNHCKHVFCRPCLQRWFSIRPNCPICRYQYNVNTINDSE